MSTFRNLEEAKEFFAKDLFASENGITLDGIGDDWAKASVILTDRHRNAQGGIMGGVMFTLADLAFAAACNNVHSPSVQSHSQRVSCPAGEHQFPVRHQGQPVICTCKMH